MQYHRLNTIIDFILLSIGITSLWITFVIGNQYIFVIILKITFFYSIFIQLINYIIKQK